MIMAPRFNACNYAVEKHIPLLLKTSEILFVNGDAHSTLFSPVHTCELNSLQTARECFANQMRICVKRATHYLRTTTKPQNWYASRIVYRWFVAFCVMLFRGTRTEKFRFQRKTLGSRRIVCSMVFIEFRKFTIFLAKLVLSWFCSGS